MKQRFLLLAMAASVISIIACNSGNTSNKEDSVDSARASNDSAPSTNTNASNFMTKAASGGMLEVQLGQMAQQKGVNQRVKDFGLMMIRDHSKNNEEMKQIAQQKGLTLPQTLSDDNQKMVDKLSKEQGNDFDKAYVDMMEKDHKEDIDEYNKAVNNIGDPMIKAYAKNTIPALQMHLDSVQALKKSMK